MVMEKQRIDADMTYVSECQEVDLTNCLVGFWVMRPLKSTKDEPNNQSKFTVIGSTKDMVMSNFVKAGYDSKLYTAPYRRVMSGDDFCQTFLLVTEESASPLATFNSDQQKQGVESLSDDPVNLAEVYPIT